LAREKKPPPQKKALPDYLASYADMVTVLMTFFVLLFAMSELDVEKYQQLAQSYKGTVLSWSGGLGLNKISVGITDTTGGPDVDDEINEDSGEYSYVPANPAEEISAEELAELAELRRIVAQLEKIQYTIKTYMAENYLVNASLINMSVEGGFLRIVFDEGLPLFDSGRADIRPEALPALTMIAEKLLEFPDNRILVEGHTDNIPQRRDPYPSNFHLSGARAISVVEFFIEMGLEPSILSGVGRGEYHPIDTNETPEGRANNRRVEIKVYADVELENVDAGFSIPWE